MIHVAARLYLITLHTAEQYRSGSPTRAGSSWRRITGASRPSLPKRLTRRRVDLRELNRSPSFGTVSNSLLALPRANIYQDTTRENFHSCVGIERSEVGGSRMAIRGERIRLSARDRRERTRRVRRISGPGERARGEDRQGQ